MDQDEQPGQHGYIHRKEDYPQRLRRIEGQARGLQKMVEDEKYCIDILTQVSAMTKASQSVALGLLFAHCSPVTNARTSGPSRPTGQRGIRRRRRGGLPATPAGDLRSPFSYSPGATSRPEQRNAPAQPCVRCWTWVPRTSRCAGTAARSGSLSTSWSWVTCSWSGRERRSPPMGRCWRDRPR